MKSQMSRVVSLLVLPTILSIAFFAVAATPVEVLGCRNRGLAAFAVALVSGLAGVWAALVGLRGRLRGDPGSGWWVVRSLLFAVPVAALLALS